MKPIILKNGLEKLILMLGVTALFTLNLHGQKSLAFDKNEPVSPLMISLNLGGFLVGELGGNAIVTISPKSQLVLAGAYIDYSLEYSGPPSITTNLYSFNALGFFLAPEYRFVIHRSNYRKNTISYFAGIYAKYQSLRENSRVDIQHPTGQSFSNLEYIVDYQSTIAGLTLGVNFYTKSNLFFSLWLGHGVFLNEEFTTIFNSRLGDQNYLQSGKETPLRIGLSLGVYL